MKHTLPGQLDLPETGPNTGGFLKLAASRPMLATKDQKPMNIGFFSDDSRQTDLVEMVEMFMNPVED